MLYQYADGTQGSTPWKLGADGQYMSNGTGGLMEGSVVYGQPNSGYAAGTAQSVMGQGPQVDNWSNSGYGQPQNTGGATFGGGSSGGGMTFHGGPAPAPTQTTAPAPAPSTGGGMGGAGSSTNYMDMTNPYLQKQMDAVTKTMTDNFNTGLLQPSVSNTETAVNATLGGGAGALVPAAVYAGQIGKSLVSPFSEKGRQQIVGETLRKAAGSEVDPALYRLQSAVTAGPLVPGVIPTAAEVAQNPGLAALQRTATAVDPIAMNNAATRQVMNNDARISALQKMQGDIPALTQAREDAVNQLYRDSFKSTVEIDPGIKSLLKRPVMQQAMERAKTLAANNGESLDFVKAMPSQASQILNSAGEPAFRTAATPGSMSGKAAHYMKQALDDISNAAPATGIAGNELRAVQGTLKDFLGAVEAQVPEYGMARSTYAAMSKPINQSQVIDEITKRSMNNIRGNLTPAAFNQAFSDKTVSGLLKRPTATLENTLTPSQLLELKSIRESLKGLDYAQTAGRGVGSDTVQKLAYANMLDKAGIPQVVRSLGPSGVIGNILQRGGQLAYADANRDMSELLARALLEPQMTSLLMQRAAPKAGLLNYGNTASRAGAATLPRGLLSTFQAEE